MCPLPSVWEVKAEKQQKKTMQEKDKDGATMSNTSGAARLLLRGNEQKNPLNILIDFLSRSIPGRRRHLAHVHWRSFN